MAAESWREFAAQALRSAPPGRIAKAEALRRAGREWRRMHGQTQRNPSGHEGLILLLLLGALGGYAYYQHVQQQKAAAAARASAPYMPPQTGLS